MTKKDIYEQIKDEKLFIKWGFENEYDVDFFWRHLYKIDDLFSNLAKLGMSESDKKNRARYVSWKWALEDKLATM